MGRIFAARRRRGRRWCGSALPPKRGPRAGFRRLACELLEDRCLLSGVTFITHGANSGVNGWVSETAAAIAARGGGNDEVALYTLAVEKEGAQIVARTPHRDSGPSAWEDAVVKIDWSSVSGAPFNYHPASDIANAVFTYLTTYQVEGRWLFASDVHLIGHSRGVSVNTDIAQRLGELGIWVEQFTALDPCPYKDDHPVQIWNNVDYADNYFETFDWIHGEAVSGTHALQFTSGEISGGYGGFAGYHSNIHLWYHGTIDTSPTASQDGHTVPTNWYQGNKGPRAQIGYYYSAVVGGQPRALDGVAVALGGAAARVAIADQSQAVWPNILYLAMGAPDSSITVGTPLGVAYWFQDYDSSAVSTFYFDPDQNPYNGNEIQADQRAELPTGASPRHESQDVSTDAGQPNTTYYVFARVSDGPHTRYVYAPGSVTLLAPPLPASVVGRYVFYNNSAFDGGSAGADLRDDAAIATDKRALLPGGQATFANYTSYSRGINGIMVDIHALANPSGLTPADFLCRVGNDNHPEGAGWTAATAPSVAVRDIGTGVTRVTLTWPDNTIKNQWLQVTVRHGNTGLPADDVFYFGNAVGESGNNAADAVVDLADELAVRSHKTGFTPAPVTNPYDFNRDRRVNATDELLARYNHSGADPLQLIDLADGGLPLIAAHAALEPAPQDPAAWSLSWAWLCEYESPRAKKGAGLFLGR